MGQFAKRSGEKNGTELALRDLKSFKTIAAMADALDHGDLKFKTYKNLFSSTAVNSASFKFALQKGDNGDLLADILRTQKDPTQIQISILKLLTKDEDKNFFERGGFGKDSFKGKFILAYLSLDVSEYHSDAARKTAIKTKLEKMQEEAPEGSELKTALGEILNSKTFAGPKPTPRTASCFSRLFGKAPAATTAPAPAK